jgi:hypothetical protein
MEKEKIEEILEFLKNLKTNNQEEDIRNLTYLSGFIDEKIRDLLERTNIEQNNLANERIELSERINKINGEKKINIFHNQKKVKKKYMFYEEYSKSNNFEIIFDESGEEDIYLKYKINERNYKVQLDENLEMIYIYHMDNTLLNFNELKSLYLFMKKEYDKNPNTFLIVFLNLVEKYCEKNFPLDESL